MCSSLPLIDFEFEVAQRFRILEVTGEQKYKGLRLGPQTVTSMCCYVTNSLTHYSNRSYGVFTVEYTDLKPVRTPTPRKSVNCS